MRASRLLLVVILVACTVSLAGCGTLDSSGTGTDTTSTSPATPADRTETDQSESGDSTANETTTDDEQSDQQDDTETDRVPVVGDELGVDQDVVFAQLNTLLETNVSAPERIAVSEERSVGPSRTLNRGWVRLLIDEKVRSVPCCSGGYGDGEIAMRTADRETTDTEATLVHEYVHHVQAEKNLETPEGSGTSYYESRSIETALDEGGAVYVTNRYIMEYMDWQQLRDDQIAFVNSSYDGRFNMNESGIDSQIDYIEAGYKQGNAAERYFMAPYYYGSQYLAAQNASLTEYFELYENPPTTTEQLIHGYKPGEEEPVPLEVTTSGVPNDNVITRGPLGELTLRLTLFSELNETRATTAAEGWGNGSVVGTVTDDEQLNLVWTLRMDTESDAEELRTAMTAYLDGRATKTDGLWFDDDDSVSLTVDAPDDRTVVLAVGPKSFVRSITVSSDGEKDTVQLNFDAKGSMTP